MTLFPVLCSLDTSLTFPACASKHLLEGSGRPLSERQWQGGLMMFNGDNYISDKAEGIIRQEGLVT